MLRSSPSIEKLRDLNYQEDEGLKTINQTKGDSKDEQVRLRSESTEHCGEPAESANVGEEGTLSTVKTESVNHEEEDKEEADKEDSAEDLKEMVRSQGKKSVFCSSPWKSDRQTDVEELLPTTYNPYKLFVSNIHYKANQRKLWQFFETFGKVKYCQILQKRTRLRTSSNRGIGFVTFSSPEEVIRVLEVDEDSLIFMDRVLIVEKARDKPRWKPKVKTEEQDAVTVSDDRACISEVSITQPGKTACDTAESAVDRLDDDVLLLIFQHLTLSDRIRSERVCKKWQRLLLSSWQTVKVFRTAEFENNMTNEIVNKMLRRGCPGMRHVDLSGKSMFLTDPALNSIAKYCPNLTRLDLYNISASNKTLQHLSRSCCKLQSIHFFGTMSFGEDGLWWLFHLCKELTYVNIEGNNRIQGKCFHVLGHNVKQFILTSCKKVKDSGIEKIVTRCSQLEELNITDCDQLTDLSLQYIATHCPSLCYLYMGKSIPQVTSAGLEYLCHLSNLRGLDCSESFGINDGVLSNISVSCNKLTKLDISGCHKELTDAGVHTLSQLPDLTELNLSYLRKIGPSGFMPIFLNGKLSKFRCRGCKQFTDECFEVLVFNCDQLHYVDLSGCDQLSKKCLHVLSSLHLDVPCSVEIVLGGTSIEKEDVEDWKDKPEGLKLSLVDFCDYHLKGDMYHGAAHVFYDQLYGSSDEENIDEILVPEGCFSHMGMSAEGAEAFLDNDDPLAQEEWDLS